MMKGFVAYSKADSEAVGRLMVHLKSLEYEGLVETWYDQQLVPGDEWDAKIHTELSTADVVIFCVSADLLATEYVQRVEIPIAISRHDHGEATVIPVVLRPCAWENSKLAKLQGVPANGRTVQDHGPYEGERIWADVRRSIEEKLRLRLNQGQRSYSSGRRSDSSVGVKWDVQEERYSPLRSEPALIKRLHGTIAEPFPPLEDWQRFCQVALSVLTLQFVVDRLYEQGKGAFERNLRVPLVQEPADNLDADFDVDVDGKEVSDMVINWCLEGHDLGVKGPKDGSWMPTHPSLVYGIIGDWCGWNDFLGHKPGDVSYNDNLHADMIEEKAFEHYVVVATRVLRLIEQGRRAREWSEWKIFDFLKRSTKYWIWDPRHRGQDHPWFGKRRFGAMKGQIVVDDAILDPLPERELARWEGKGE